MSAQELTIVNDLLRAARTTPQAPGWPERRAAMEATLAAFPLAEGVLREPVDANGVAAEWQGRADAAPHIVMLYLHGGGYCVGSVATHRPLTTAIAHDFAGRVLSVDYRLAPEHPCPAAIDDAIAAYRFLLGQGVGPFRPLGRDPVELDMQRVGSVAQDEGGAAVLDHAAARRRLG